MRKSKIAKLQKKIAGTKKKRATAMKRAKAVCDLKLKVVSEPAKGKSAKKASAG